MAAWLIAFIAVTAVSLLPVLFIAGRRYERRIAGRWDLVLRNEDEMQLSAVGESVRDEWQVADVMCRRAHEIHVGSPQEALRLLDGGLELIQAHSPNMIAFLRAMTDYSRMISAIAPLPPLRPQAFRAAPVVTLAYVHALIQRFLVSTGERFRFRAYVLARCFATAARYMWMYARRLRIKPDLDRDWGQVEALRHDLGELTEASLEQYRALVLSLGAMRRRMPPAPMSSDPGLGERRAAGTVERS
jgi:hypothetical protein